MRMMSLLFIIPVLILMVSLPSWAFPESPASQPASISMTYRPVAERIIATTLAGNDGFRKLEELSDDVGHRLSGSEGLEKALVWAVETLNRDGQENVHLETVPDVPHWVRGRESITLLAPLVKELPMLGLGGSVGTPPEGITAEVIAVADENELAMVAGRVKGKIILFDNPMPDYDPILGSRYGEAVRFRAEGPRLAAENGAVACLIRSVTATSLRTPHTGMTRYDDAPYQVPAAALSVEDAAMITRLQRRGMKVELCLKMEAKNLEPVNSANVIAELRGREKPDEIVVIGGHIDSWDVGQGTHDDGAGCVMAMEALNVLRKMNLQPRRTIRVVLWTNEENGLRGGKQYALDHQAELANHVAAIESDAGGFAPTGYSVDHQQAAVMNRAAEQLREMMTLLIPLGPMETKTGFSGADVHQLREGGVVLMGHLVEGERYFDFHHSPADTLDKVDPQELAKSIAALATTAYIIADMPPKLGQ
ncbi:MAG: hypothetical protein HJJLKODD_01929 [Phycisphaerae bacterium]|nr:hypothetical protein [Phycisphaerae bacterium]